MYLYLHAIIFIILNLIIYFNFNYINSLINIYDEIGEDRKIHKERTPLLGGFIILINTVLFLFLINLETNINSFFNLNLQFTLVLMMMLFSNFILGVYDDKFNLKARYKLFFITLIIGVSLLNLDIIVIKEIRLSFYDNIVHLNYFSYFFSLFCYLIFLNAYNMYDGINLQNGIYAIGIFLYFILNSIEPFFSYVLIMALINFLILNYKGRTFMGDSGTIFISIIISTIVIYNYNANKIIYADEIFLLMIIPGLEIIRLFIIRLIKRKSPFKPDRNHLHHLLIKKYSVIKSNYVLAFLSFSPIILSIFISNLISIFYGITIYIVLIIYLKIHINKY